MTKRIDFPLEDVARQCGEHQRLGRMFWQKFSCEKCGERNTIEVPNQLYAQGTCSDCGHTTDLRVTGCNFLLAFQVVRPVPEPTNAKS